MTSNPQTRITHMPYLLPNSALHSFTSAGNLDISVLLSTHSVYHTMIHFEQLVVLDGDLVYRYETPEAIGNHFADVSVDMAGAMYRDSVVVEDEREADTVGIDESVDVAAAIHQTELAVMGQQ